MFVEKLVVPPTCFGGDPGTDLGDMGTDAGSVVDDIFSRDAEVQSAADSDWDSSSGDQTKKESAESETGDGEEDQEGAEEETDSSEEGEDEESESEEESDGEVVLPKQQAKQYDDKLMAHFAKRIGATLADLKGNQPLQKAVKQLIDNAIFTEQQNAKLAELSTEDETGKEEEEVKVEDKKTETSQTPEEQFKAFDTQLTNLVKQVNDPQMVEAAVKARALSWGINPDDPKQMEALKAKGIDLAKGIETDSKFALNLINSSLPIFLPQILESMYPGIGEMLTSATDARSWDKLTKSKEFASAELPAFGSPEFSQKLSEVLKANPWIDSLKFDGPAHAQRAGKYKVAAQLMAGHKPDQAVVEKALETGRREERKAQVKKSGATKMGAGKTDGNFGTAKPQKKGSGLGLVEEYEARKGAGF